ncbi:MAG TPA: gas vesicle protein [Solirubrobacteraceae bacterium]|nr:gas vesicle protein [Solirubrobacteraceae bacterium]
MSEREYMPRRLSPHGTVRADLAPPPAGPASLADILERVLDKGIVIAGDIQVNLLDIELLTIKIRLLVASVDRAKEMGINWWEGDPRLSSGARQLEQENTDLRERLDRLEERLSLAPEAAVEDAPTVANPSRTEVTEQARRTTDAETGRTVSAGKRKTVTEEKP